MKLSNKKGWDIAQHYKFNSEWYRKEKGKIYLKDCLISFHTQLSNSLDYRMNEFLEVTFRVNDYAHLKITKPREVGV